MVYDIRSCLWFGTMEYMDWFKTPLQGADMSPQSWNAGGTLLNGGGYELNSWGSHKLYTFEWPASSSVEVAQLLKSYADGAYGRGPIYFVDPLIYGRNILPARVADPSMAVDDEGASLVYGVDPEPVITSGWRTNMLPIRGAYYNLGDTPEGFRGVEDAVFIPIPTGYTLGLGAFYEATGSGGIFISPQNTNGTIGTAVALTPLAPDSVAVISDIVSDVTGVWIWVGKTAPGAATVTARALIARLVDTAKLALTGTVYGEGVYGEGVYGGILSVGFTTLTAGPWIGGMGNSGVRFSGKPTWTANSPINGGRIGASASFREIGSWSS